MKPQSKLKFFTLTFLLIFLHLSLLKSELILLKSEKHNILQKNQNKFEISFQKFLPKKSLKKEVIFKKEEVMNFAEVSKEEGKNEKSIIKDERDENNLRQLQSGESYIKVYYDKDAVYSSGYRANYAKYSFIEKIVYQGEIYTYDQNLFVDGGNSLEIYITPSAYELSIFFYSTPQASIETNCNSIISIDLSHLTNQFKRLSNFFTGCHGFKAVDMSGLNLINYDDNSDIFDMVTSIKYLNIYNALLNDNIKESIINHFNNDYANDLTVCQSEQIITVTKFVYQCCNFNLQYDICESSNHIDIYFGKNIQYSEGFNINTESNHRDSIAYLAVGDDILKLGQFFNLNQGLKLEIYFSPSIKTLESFFDHN